MAKYIYTSGKRKGKVYQEFYYTLNGQQIVNKKSFYCPVNTKWLSKEEFKQYILQLIRDEYPNYLVVDELPEELDTHIIYFLKQVNPDQSVYYDVYVYDEEQLKHIVFKGADIPELEQIKQVVNDIVNYSLKNVYNVNLPANRVVITDTEGNLRAGNTDPVDLDLHLYWTANGSLKNIYDKTVSADRVMISDNNGYVTTSSFTATTVNDVITGVTTKSLKNIYNTELAINKFVVTDIEGNLTVSTFSISSIANVISFIITKSLKNIYNKVLSANKDIVTDASGYLTTAEKPHLYAHHYFYDHSGRGEVNFVIYSKKSTELGNSELGTYLKNLGCDESFRAYPANGQNQANGAIVNGIFVKSSGSSMVPYTIWVTSYNIGSMFTEQISNYPGTHFIKIVQIF